MEFESMSGSQMKAWLPFANIMTYQQLGERAKRGCSIDDVLGDAGVCVLLYLVGKDYGHWTLVMRRGDVVECFDSYGYKPDDEFTFVPKGIRERTNQNFRYLTQLLYNSRYRTEYNEVPFQADTPGLATCGRHCIARVAHRGMSIASYQRKFDRLDLDSVVSAAVPNVPPT